MPNHSYENACHMYIHFLENAIRVSHFVPFVMHIYHAKFQEHCFNISRDIVYSVFSTF